MRLVLNWVVQTASENITLSLKILYISQIHGVLVTTVKTLQIQMLNLVIRMTNEDIMINRKILDLSTIRGVLIIMVITTQIHTDTQKLIIVDTNKTIYLIISLEVVLLLMLMIISENTVVL